MSKAPLEIRSKTLADKTKGITLEHSKRSVDFRAAQFVMDFHELFQLLCWLQRNFASQGAIFFFPFTYTI